MTKGFRTFLFAFFLLAFAVAAPAIALYAQGYRLNWPIEPGKKLIVKTGGFFAKAYPKQIDVYVNGRAEKQTDFFFDSALVTNLLPRQHLFEIKKTGYQTWAKNLEVREKEVVEAKNIFLFPELPQFKTLEENIADFSVSPDRQKIALRHEDGTSWNIKLYDIGRAVTAKLAGQSNFALKDPAFSGWTWIDKNTIEISAKSKDASETYLIAIDKNPPQLVKKIPPEEEPAGKEEPEEISAVSVAPAAGENAAEEKPGAPRELARGQNGGADYYLADDGFIYKQENGGEPALAAAGRIDVAAEAGYKLEIFGDYFFVAAEDRLMAIRKDGKEFEKILDSAPRGTKMAPNGKRVVYWSNSEIWIFHLEKKTDPPAAEAGEKTFIARFSEKITDCDWFNSDYLIFTAGDRVRTAEIDNRDKINFAEIAEFSKIGGENSSEGKMFMDQDKKILYLLAGKTLRQTNLYE